jgi:hypothetical protein
MHARRFGWLPLPIDDRGAKWRLTTLVDFSEGVTNVLESERVDKDWYWPNIMEDTPRRPTEVYALPATHELTIDTGGFREQRLAEFMIAVLGFLYGMLLTPEGWVQFNRVSINPRRWQDFGMTNPARSRILDQAVSTWETDIDHQEALFGALWWHTYAIAYEHPFERFMAQYVVLDACWAIHEGRTRCKRPPHAARISALASAYNLQPPKDWSRAGANDELATLRNQLFHEAKWAGQPIGFGHPARPLEGVHLELYWFNSRLILALLGENSSYVHSEIIYQPRLIT